MTCVASPRVATVQGRSAHLVHAKSGVHVIGGGGHGSGCTSSMPAPADTVHNGFMFPPTFELLPTMRMLSPDGESP